MLTEKELPIDIMIADGNPLVLSAMSEVLVEKAKQIAAG